MVEPVDTWLRDIFRNLSGRYLGVFEKTVNVMGQRKASRNSLWIK